MTDQLQAVFIRTHATRSKPEPHIVYQIEVQSPSRQWQVWRRYSEFVDLSRDLRSQTGSPPPTVLPAKHAWSTPFRRTLTDPVQIQERREGLETFLRAIVGNRDSRWRDSLAFKEFLNVPIGKSSHVVGRDGDIVRTDFTSSSWIEEHSALSSMTRDIRASINKRDSLLSRGDTTTAHQTNVDAKKKLAVLVSRLTVLAKGLDELGLSGMAEGELRRRADMVSRLQDEMETLSKLAIAARAAPAPAHNNPSGSSLPTSSSSRPNSNVRDSADRSALFAGSETTTGASRPIATTRVFGARAPAEETSETRPLDNTGLLQLQQTHLDTQDSKVSALSSILRRQKDIAVAIGAELDEQNEMLDQLQGDVDRTGTKLGKAKEKIKKLGS